MDPMNVPSFRRWTIGAVLALLSRSGVSMSRALMSVPVAETSTVPEPTDFEPIAGPTHDEIAAEAYAIYAANGHQDGRDVENWIEAEHALLERRARVLRD